MSDVASLVDQNFKDVVLHNSKPVMVDFWATWCGPCRALAPFVEKLAKTNGDKVNIYKANVEECDCTSVELGVQNLPCVIFFKDGKEVDRVVGANQAKIQEIVNSL